MVIGQLGQLGQQAQQIHQQSQQQQLVNYKQQMDLAYKQQRVQQEITVTLSLSLYNFNNNINFLRGFSFLCLAPNAVHRETIACHENAK